jgi:hypothetical protein
MTWAFQATPTTPRPLSPMPAIVPVVCVPWPWSSNGSLVLATKFQPTRSST